MIGRRAAETLAPLLRRAPFFQQLIDVVEFDLFLVTALLRGAVLLKVFQRLVGRAVKSQVAAFGQEYDLIAHHHVFGGVGDQDHRAPAIGQVAEQLHHLRLGAGVQAGGGLVQEEQPRLGEQLDAHGHPLALAAAQGGDQVVLAVLQPQLTDDLHDPLMALLFGGIGGHSQLGGIVQRLVNGQLAVDDVLLGDVAHLAAVLVHVGIQVLAVDQDHRFLAVGRVEAGQGVHQGGFARAAGPHDGDELFGVDGDGHFFQDADRLAVPLFDADGVQADVARFVKAGDAVFLKDQAEGGDADHIPFFDPDLFIHPLAVDERAVVAAEIAQAEAGTELLDDGVVAGDAGVLQDDGVAAVPPDGDASSLFGQAAHVQELGLGCSGDLFFGLGRHETDKGPVLHRDLLADIEHVAVAEGVVGNAAALVGQAIGAAQVHHAVGIALALQAGVVARNLGIGDADVVARPAAKGDDLLLQGEFEHLPSHVDNQARRRFGAEGNGQRQGRRWRLIGTQAPHLEGKDVDLHHVARFEGRRTAGGHPLAVEKGSVAGIEIAHHPTVAAQAELGVFARNAGVVEDDVVVLAPPDADGGLVEGQFVCPATGDLYLKNT